MPLKVYPIQNYFKELSPYSDKSVPIKSPDSFFILIVMICVLD